MITFKQKGNFSKLTTLLEKNMRKNGTSKLDQYGKLGVEALSKATPKDTGKTAESWSYEITDTAKGAKITWHNSNVNKGVLIAIILQYGHGTGTGGWVEGRDYINPAIQPIFDQLANEAWKEMTET